MKEKKVLEALEINKKSLVMPLTTLFDIPFNYLRSPVPSVFTCFSSNDRFIECESIPTNPHCCPYHRNLQFPSPPV